MLTMPRPRRFWFAHSEWLGVFFILSLGLSLIARFINNWARREWLAMTANVLLVIPLGIVIFGLAVILFHRFVLDRRGWGNQKTKGDVHRED